MIDTTYNTQVIITEGEYTRLLYVERNFEEAVKSGVALRKDQHTLAKINRIKMSLKGEINLLRTEYSTLMVLVHSVSYINYWKGEHSKRHRSESLEIGSYKGGNDIVISSNDYNHLIAVYNNFLSVVNDNLVLPTEEEISEVLEKDTEHFVLKETISHLQNDVKVLEEQLEIKRGGRKTHPDKYKSDNNGVWWLLGGIIFAIIAMCFLGG